MNRARFTASCLLAVSLVGCGSDTFQNPTSPSAPSRVSAATVFASGKTVVKEPNSLSTFTEPDGSQVEAGANQLIVSFDHRISDERLDSLLQIIQDAGGQVVGDIPATFQIELEFPAGVDLVAMQQQLKAQNGILDVSLNTLVAIDQAPLPVNPVPASFNGDYWVNSINAPAGWGYLNQSNPFPLVGIADAGFNLSAGVLDTSRIAALSDSQGQALTDNDSDDPNSLHGTKVLAYAIGNGASGSSVSTVGVNWGSRALIVKVLGAQQTGFLFNSEAGVVHALQRGSRFVNLSVGSVVPQPAQSENQFYFTRQRFRASFSSALEFASQRDAVVCFSAGNDGGGQGRFQVKRDDQFLPQGSPENANVWSTHALIVGACNAANSMTGFSREGQVVHLAAPGEAVGYGRSINGVEAGNGTSYAAPLAMGACSALLNVNPDLMACEARAIVLRTLTNNLNSLAGQIRQLNFGAAAQVAANVPARDTNAFTFRLGTGQSQTVAVTVENPIGSPTQDLSLFPIGDADQYTHVSPPTVAAVAPGQSATFQVTFSRNATPSAREITQPFMLWGFGSQGRLLRRVPVTITTLAN